MVEWVMYVWNSDESTTNRMSTTYLILNNDDTFQKIYTNSCVEKEKVANVLSYQAASLSDIDLKKELFF